MSTKKAPGKSPYPAKAGAAKSRAAKAPSRRVAADGGAADGGAGGGAGDWRARTLARVRAIMRQADGHIVEEVKWRKPSNPAGVPVWSHPSAGMICTGETYRDKVKLTFARGAALADPSGLFNAGLDGNVRRAIDIREGEKLNEPAFTNLVRAAVALNNKVKPQHSAPSTQRSPKLLSGGNPQIPKGHGDEPVQAYIDALGAGPAWKQDMARRLDALIVKAVPKARKAVKWNSPFYGAADEAQGWFVSFHCFTKYIKMTFFRGSSLRPAPPGESKHKEVRYLDIYEGWKDSEGGKIDEAQVTKWVKQASKLPGERL